MIGACGGRGLGGLLVSRDGCWGKEEILAVYPAALSSWAYLQAASTDSLLGIFSALGQYD